MSLPKIQEIKTLTDPQIEKEILSAKKELFELRVKKGTKQSFKSHSFKHTKHRLGQLLMVKKERILFMIQTNEGKI